jgi:hypothetical protein
MGKSGFRALAGPLRQVRWSNEFKNGKIDQYEGSNNTEEFIQCIKPSMIPSEETIG